MISLKSILPRSRPATVTCWLIALNIIVFCGEWLLGGTLLEFINLFAVRPGFFIARWTEISARAWVPFILSMFMHPGWLHLAGNMLIPWVFSANVEDRLSHGRYLSLYFLGGFAAACSHHVQYHRPMPKRGPFDEQRARFILCD